MRVRVAGVLVSLAIAVSACSSTAGGASSPKTFLAADDIDHHSGADADGTHDRCSSGLDQSLPLLHPI